MKNINKNVKKLYQNTETVLSRHPRITLACILLISALLIVSRRTQAFTNPQFWAEDGKYWYADAYNGDPFSSLFILYGGYLVVVYRIFASISLLLPFEHAPLFFNLCALLFQLLPVLLINSGRLKKIIPSRLLAIFITFLYIGIPNSSEVFLNLTNIQWHLGIASFLVLVSEKSKSIYWKVFDYFVLIATGLAGPLVIVLLPIALILWYKSKSVWHKRNLIILGCLALLQLLCIFFISDYERVGGQPDASILKFIKMIVGQIFSGSLLGEKDVNQFYANELLLIVMFLLILAVLIYVMKNAPLWLKLFNLYGFLLIASMLVSLKPTPEFDTWLGLTNPGGGQRYWYIPTVIWVTDVLWLAFRAKIKTIRYVALVFLILITSRAIPADWRLREYSDYSFQYSAKVFNEAPKGSLISIPVNPAWYMYLNKE